jgi:hypothetical protein
MNSTTTQGEEVSEQWHLDKKVPLSLIFAMLIQAAHGDLGHCGHQEGRRGAEGPDDGAARA